MYFKISANRYRLPHLTAVIIVHIYTHYHTHIKHTQELQLTTIY